MAEGKKTFIFYSDWINMVREMPNEDAGILLKHILSYVNDEEPTTDNLLVKMAFGHMKPMLKSDLDKWHSIREKRKISGAKGGKASAKQKQASAKQVQAVNDNVNVYNNNNNSKNVVFVDSYDEFKNQIAEEGNTMWIESFYMKFKLKEKTLSKVMEDFILHIKCLPKGQPTTLNEFKTHFYNWCLKVDPIGKLDSYKKYKPKEKGAI